MYYTHLLWYLIPCWKTRPNHAVIIYDLLYHQEITSIAFTFFVHEARKLITSCIISHQSSEKSRPMLPPCLSFSPPTPCQHSNYPGTSIPRTMVIHYWPAPTVLHPIAENQRSIPSERDPLLTLILPVVVHEDDVERVEVTWDEATSPPINMILSLLRNGMKVK